MFVLKWLDPPQWLDRVEVDRWGFSVAHWLASPDAAKRFATREEAEATRSRWTPASLRVRVQIEPAP